MKRSNCPKGYYFDEKINRYFKIPQQGSFEYANYLEILKIKRKSKINPLSTKNTKILNIHSFILKNEISPSMKIKEDFKFEIIKNTTHLTKFTYQFELDHKNTNSIVINPNFTNQFAIASEGPNYLTIYDSQDNEMGNKPNTIFDLDFDSNITGLNWNSFLSLSLLGSSGNPGKMILFDHNFNQIQTIHLQKGSLLSHALSNVKNSFIFGTDKNAFFGPSLELRILQQIKSTKSSVLASLFSVDGNQFFLGTRSGKILTYDVRQKCEQDNSFSMNHKSSICKIIQRKDPYYLISNSRDGKIIQWERRMGKELFSLSYDNEYENFQFSIDSNEEYLTIGDNENFVKVWNLRNAISKEQDFKIGPFKSKISTLIWNNHNQKTGLWIPEFNNMDVYDFY